MLCLKIAKKQNKNPEELAKELAKKLKIKFLETKIIGPYLNFYINWKEFGQGILENINENYGKSEKIEKKNTIDMILIHVHLNILK